MRYLFFLILIHSVLVSLPVGNPEDPQIIEQGLWIPQSSMFCCKIGCQSHAVLDKKLQWMEDQDRLAEHLRITLHQTQITVNYLDRLEGYGSWGRWSCSQKRSGPLHAEGLSAGGGGVKVLLAQWKNSGIGVDGKLQWGKSRSIHYREWQTAFSIYYGIGLVTPYVGIKYSRVHICVHNPKVKDTTVETMRNPHRVGMAFGWTVSGGEKISLFGEISCLDERAVSFGASLRL